MASKRVTLNQLKPGDVVRNERGLFVVQYVQRNRRGAMTYFGAYEKHLAPMLKDPTNTKLMQFYTTTPRNMDTVEVVKTVSSSVIKKMSEMSTLLQKKNAEVHSANMDKLNLKWNPDKLQKHGHRYFRGGNDVMTMKGEHVSAGDLVMVQFSNGKFEMVMGNENNVTYDGKTGRYYCRSPWKVGLTPKVKLKYVFGRGTVPVVSKVKARSMPPETLLYLIKKGGN